MTHLSLSRRAEVSSATESEPCSGSVSANAPSLSSCAMLGSQRCFCSSEPSIAIDCMASPPWTPQERSVAAVAPVESMWIRPVAIGLIGGQP